MYLSKSGLTIGLIGLIVLALLFSSTIGVSGEGLTQLDFTPTAFIYLPLVVNNPIPAEVLVAEQRIAELINQERSKCNCGLSPLTLAAPLTRSARRHSDDMAQNNFFSHSGSDGSRFSERIIEENYNWSGAGAENIACRSDNDLEAVIRMWMNSKEGHREVILSATYTEFGVGYANNPASRCKNYFTVDFAIPASP